MMRKITITLSGIHPILNELITLIAQNPSINTFGRKLTRSKLLQKLILEYIEQCVTDKNEPLALHIKERLNTYYSESKNT